MERLPGWHCCGAAIARRGATRRRDNNRLSRVFEALAALGIHAEPAVYAEEMADEVREQLLRLDGVLVWVNPIFRRQEPPSLDAMLRTSRPGRLGQRASRRDSQDGREGGSASHEAPRLGHRHPSLSRPPRRSAKSSRRGFSRRARVSSSKTAATAARASGRSSSLRLPPGDRSFACCRRAGAVCRKTCRSAISCDAARRISQPKAASSISRSSRGCPTA